jgi:hypothetical protein
MANLTPAQSALIVQASRVGVVSKFVELRKYFARSRWLGKQNRYLKRTTDRIKIDLNSSGINSKHLAEYIAASVPLHCADGWGFLARAIASHAAGDPHQARHLGYYAELRASMSLLASEGIGIFSDRHFVVDSNGACLRIPGTLKTHTLAWDALDVWATHSSSAALLASVLRPGGYAIETWLAGFSVTSANLNLIGAEWLRAWGLDIRRLAEDRDARNEASYRPNRINRQSTLDPKSSVHFILDLWRTFEPAGSMLSVQLDRFLLRVLLEKAFFLTAGRSYKQSRGTFRSRITVMVDRMGLSGNLREEWLGFLLRETSREDPRIIAEAMGRLEIDDPYHHVQVLARSALLLWMATGACARLFQDAGTSRGELAFWWGPLGEDKGLWSINGEPDEFRDLWADIEAAAIQTGGWLEERSDVNVDRMTLLRALSSELIDLTSCERMLLWGTSP